MSIMRYYMGLEPLYGKGSQSLLSAGWQAELGELTVSGINNRLI
jgi:hypothetical protein